MKKNMNEDTYETLKTVRPCDANNDIKMSISKTEYSLLLNESNSFEVSNDSLI